MTPKSKQASEHSVNVYLNSLPSAGQVMKMDDGPMPMKNMKPAQKQPNGADQFKQEHKGEHDQPSDKCRRAEEHNKACPKLEDELDKRRSTSKVTPIKLEMSEKESNLGRRTAKNTYYDPKCPKCVKERQAQMKKKAMEDKKKARGKNSRVSKTRRPYRRRMSGLKLGNPKSTNRCKFDSNLTVMTRSPVTRLSINMADEKKAPKQKGSVKSRTEQSEDGKSNASTEIYPDNSIPSVTSYNSFLSMDHEPMVSP